MSDSELMLAVSAIELNTAPSRLSADTIRHDWPLTFRCPIPPSDVDVSQDAASERGE